MNSYNCNNITSHKTISIVLYWARENATNLITELLEEAIHAHAMQEQGRVLHVAWQSARAWVAMTSFLISGRIFLQFPAHLTLIQKQNQGFRSLGGRPQPTVKVGPFQKQISPEYSEFCQTFAHKWPFPPKIYFSNLGRLFGTSSFEISIHFLAHDKVDPTHTCGGTGLFVGS